MKQRGFEVISKQQFDKDFSKESISKCRYEDLKLPKRATAKSAGYDVFIPYSVLLNPGDSELIPTGIKAYMLDDEVLFAYPRSGLGFKFFIRLANTVGVIDSDYYNNAGNEGHIWVKIRNEGDKPITLEKDTAFCQFIFQKYLLTDDDDFSGKKRAGGFGSTN